MKLSKNIGGVGKVQRSFGAKRRRLRMTSDGKLECPPFAKGAKDGASGGRVASSAIGVKVPRPPRGHSTLRVNLDKLLCRIKTKDAGGG